MFAFVKHLNQEFEKKNAWKHYEEPENSFTDESAIIELVQLHGR